MSLLKFQIFCLLILISNQTSAQSGWGRVEGRVVNEEGQSLPGVSVTVLGQRTGILVSDSGTFAIRMPAGRAFALVFSLSGYKEQQQNFILNENEVERVTVRLSTAERSMQEVIIRDGRVRREVGLIRVNPSAAINIPAPIMGVESLIKVLVGSNNELSSQYNVRGGSFDENLVYVNDFEIFRPYLVRSGQQEGLSFINPSLVRNINFYNGSFGARYGDKLSSVLDIQYIEPKKSEGSAYLSLLEQGAHVAGRTSGGTFSYVLGARNRSNQNLLKRQATRGNYRPSSADVQGLFTWNAGRRWSNELLLNYSRTKFQLEPAFSQLSSSVFSPLFTSNIGVDIYFEGRERDEYRTLMTGLSSTYRPDSLTRLKILVSRFENNEEENIDITGAYLFGDRDFDPNSSTVGQIINPLGAGINQQFARNRLNVLNYAFAHKGQRIAGRHLIQWGGGYDRTTIDDRLREWEYVDSAGYSLPYTPGTPSLAKSIQGRALLNVNKYHVYLQDNLAIDKGGTNISLQGGVRVNYNDLNRDWLFSPRMAASIKPDWKKDVILKLSAGLYAQPPFYRELRRYDGSVNAQLKAQKSFQVVAGMDYSFVGFGRPLRLSAEAYYKNLWDVVAYDIDNVRLRYFGENNARAYAAGLEFRLFGEIVKDAESWVSLGFMRTREDLENDTYYRYTVDANNKPVDSTLVENGWLRRPTDRLITFGMFFQDYLSTNKNFKVYLNSLYGTNLPYNIPGSVRFRNALRIEPYIRVDIGFSALLLNPDKTERRSHSPFRNFESIWISLEVFNLLDRENTISYLLIRDFQSNTFALPNRLTPRLLNLKLAASF